MDESASPSDSVFHLDRITGEFNVSSQSPPIAKSTTGEFEFSTESSA